MGAHVHALYIAAKHGNILSCRNKGEPGNHLYPGYRLKVSKIKLCVDHMHAVLLDCNHKFITLYKLINSSLSTLFLDWLPVYYFILHFSPLKACLYPAQQGEFCLKNSKEGRSASAIIVYSSVIFTGEKSWFSSILVVLSFICYLCSHDNSVTMKPTYLHT